jgi:hypothetical protein
MKTVSKILLLGGGITAATYATYKTAKTPDGGFDIYNIGVARFGRAAITVSF